MQTKISQSKKLLEQVSGVLRDVLKEHPHLNDAINKEYAQKPYQLRTKNGPKPSVLFVFLGIVARGIVLLRDRKGNPYVGVAKSPVPKCLGEDFSPTLWEGGERLPETINRMLRAFTKKELVLKQLQGTLSRKEHHDRTKKR